MEDAKRIRLFISSPSDVKDEVEAINLIVLEINKSTAKKDCYFIECLNWSADTYTNVGEYVQAVINEQIDKEYDILVSLMWQKVGTQTKVARSGTIEEITRAINNPHKHSLIYFKTTPPESINDLDLEQIGDIRSFKQSLGELGVLYKEFNSTREFESLFRIHLINLINDNFIKSKPNKEGIINTPLEVDRYQDMSRLIQEVEQKGEAEEVDLGIFESIEKLTSSLETVTELMDSMTKTNLYLKEKLEVRTLEINKYNGIKDHRLRVAKGIIVVDLLAEELDEYNRRIENDLVPFSSNMREIGPAYFQIKQFIENVQIPDADFLRTSFIEYRDSVQDAMEQSANVLRQVMTWPALSTKFNKSKRRTEVTLKNITKEFLEGLRLLDAALTGS